MHLHLDTPGEALWAVVTGAVLATIGGFVATQLEATMHRRERQRNAALMFGEILSSLGTIARIAEQSRAHGDPYGSVTQRLLRAGLRETETYERNRSALYDLRDAEVRIRIHVMMVQLTLALEGVAESSTRIWAADEALEEPDLAAARAAAIRGRRERLVFERDGAFDYVLEVAEEITSLVAFLQPIAKVNFGDLQQFSSNPFGDT